MRLGKDLSLIHISLNLDGAEAVIEASDVEIFSEDIPGWLVANEGKLTVALEAVSYTHLSGSSTISPILQKSFDTLCEVSFVK